MAVSAIPAAVSGLLAAIGAQVPSGTGVYDGVVREGQSTESFVVISGWVSDERAPATFGAGFGQFTIEEQFEIQGYVRCLEGSTVQQVSRQQAFTVFEAVEQAVRADPTLGGAVRVAWVKRVLGTQGAANGARGNGTQLDFEVHCEARI